MIPCENTFLLFRPAGSSAFALQQCQKMRTQWHTPDCNLMLLGNEIIV